MHQKIAAYIVTGALALAPALFAADDSHQKPQPKQAPAQQAVEAGAPLLPLTLSSIFSFAAEGIKITKGAHGMETAVSPVTEVLMARRNDDGTVSTACVDNEAAARRFLASRPNVTTAAPEEK